jgi:hypothetical protein
MSLGTPLPTFALEAYFSRCEFTARDHRDAADNQNLGH